MNTNLIPVRSTLPNMEVIAITGSPKTRNLRRVAGVIVEYVSRPFGANHYVLDAVVETATGERIQTHRLIAV